MLALALQRASKAYVEAGKTGKGQAPQVAPASPSQQWQWQVALALKGCEREEEAIQVFGRSLELAEERADLFKEVEKLVCLLARSPRVVFEALPKASNNIFNI